MFITKLNVNLLMNMMTLLSAMKNLTNLQWKTFQEQSMTCLISFLHRVYRQETFTLSYRNTFTNVRQKKFLTRKICLWIVTRSSTYNHLHRNDRIVILEIKKAKNTSDGDITCHMFSLKCVLAHLAISNPSRILAIEK